MKNLLKISSLLVFIGLAFQVSTSEAQVTGVVTVSVTVIPRPAVDFPSSAGSRGSLIVGRGIASEQGMTLQGLSNVQVKLNFNKRDEYREFSFQQSRTKTIPERDLRNVKTIEILYLGS